MRTSCLAFLINLGCCLLLFAHTEEHPEEYIVAEWVVWDDAWFGPSATSVVIEPQGEQTEPPTEAPATEVTQKSQSLEEDAPLDSKRWLLPAPGQAIPAKDQGEDANLAAQLEAAVGELLELHRSTMPYEEHVAALERQRHKIVELSERRSLLLRQRAADTELSADMGPDTDMDPDTDMEPDADVESNTDGGPDADIGPDADMETDSATKPDSELEADTEPDTKTEPVAEAERTEGDAVAVDNPSTAEDYSIRDDPAEEVEQVVKDGQAIEQSDEINSSNDSAGSRDKRAVAGIASRIEEIANRLERLEEAVKSLDTDDNDNN